MSFFRLKRYFKGVSLYLNMLTFSMRLKTSVKNMLIDTPFDKIL